MPIPNNLPEKQGLRARPQQTVPRPSIPLRASQVELTGVGYVGSYNWVNNSLTPTIMVPGESTPSSVTPEYAER
ncbi:hypothetical protein FIBSPDRAFT_851635 [Athelia psychrophila]|uniref:Uncharacterized protein n=1 Tax=Athelia psychrophila TaxID=1759441 RepID=A0A166SBX0_9AGAM|nr:hypothetical protein FIBSPDRAFT_851635 [Fibularhizoctonia sp. CBS 109695]